jgi:aryl-alcohol dehydrogenase-like predicted oxidoreductase
MRYKKLGRTDIDVSVVALGTWALGGLDFGRVDDLDAIKTVHRAIDMGVTLFDTAPIYGDGHAEVILGKAFAGGLRKDVVIATKCGPVSVRQGLVRMDLSPSGIERQCDESLRRLKTDYIDLLQVHWNDPNYPIEETMIALENLVRKGKIRAFGVSNFSLEELKKACDGHNVASLQSRYSLLDRSVEEKILPFCSKNSVAFLAYEPLGRGLLAGKMDAKRRFDDGDIRKRDARFSMPFFQRLLDRVEEFKILAKRENVLPSQLAIAWILANKAVTSVIFGAKSPAQVVENVMAADIDLDDVTVRKARQIFDDVAEGRGFEGSGEPEK